MKNEVVSSRVLFPQLFSLVCHSPRAERNSVITCRHARKGKLRFFFFLFLFVCFSFGAEKNNLKQEWLLVILFWTFFVFGSFDVGFCFVVVCLFVCLFVCLLCCYCCCYCCCCFWGVLFCAFFVCLFVCLFSVFVFVVVFSFFFLSFFLFLLMLLFCFVFCLLVFSCAFFFFCFTEYKQNREEHNYMAIQMVSFNNDWLTTDWLTTHLVY